MCIHAGGFDLFGWVVLIKIQNDLDFSWKCVWNGFEGKENLKIKEFKKVVKFIFENLPKFLIFIWIKKYIWNNI